MIQRIRWVIRDWVGEEVHFPVQAAEESVRVQSFHIGGIVGVGGDAFAAREM